MAMATQNPAPLRFFGIGCGTQINAIAEVIQNNVPVKIPALAIGVVGGLFTGIVIIGGIQSIASVCEKLVPFMAFFYVLGCIGILAVNRDYLGAALTAIVQMAFVPGAVAGGLVGRGIMMAAQFGVARGLFSNESGLAPRLWWPPPPRPATRCGRRWSPPPAPFGIPWWCAL